MEINKLQRELTIWLNERGLNSKTINEWIQLSILMEEVGETSSVLTKGKGNLGEEIADVIISAVCLGISKQINVQSEIKKKLKELQGRKSYNVDGHIRITHV